ncbi:cysteine synthase CysM [uncultured Salinisphaera sp.]|uniref:cysteine synthase CysM n=1 Tax=uncultured Salinisphaera sp. TaxID=359372 RepID=UPI0032B2041A
MNSNDTRYPTLDHFVGQSALTRLQRLPASYSAHASNTLLAKLEGDNPAGSVKDRPAYSMIRRAAERGDIKPGDTLIEATSGNTGIALAMVAAMQGYRMVLIMPENMSEERRASMRAYGAEIISVSEAEGMEGARDLAAEMQREGKGMVLDQFANPDNPRAHYETTGPELWQATNGQITHFVATMGTTGTIMGCSRYLKEQNPDIQIIGVQPAGESKIPGIRRWPEEYLPKIFEPERVDQVIDVDQADAETAMKRLAREEGIFAGPSSGGSVFAALNIAREVENATIAMIICDRGDRYLSTGVYDKP